MRGLPSSSNFKLAALLLVGALGASYPLSAQADEPAPTEPSVRAETPVTAATAATQPSPTLAPAPQPSTSSAARVNLEAPASPAREARFGDADQIALTGSLSASFGNLGYSAGGSSSTSLSIQPAFDYFAARNFSVGGGVLFRYSSSTSGIDIGSKNKTFGITGQAGYNAWLGDRVSFWPKLHLGVWQSQTTYTAPGYGFSISVDGTSVAIGPSSSVTEDVVYLELFAPLLIHLAPHFFVGFGPDAYSDLRHTAATASNKRTFIGAGSTVGGWF